MRRCLGLFGSIAIALSSVGAGIAVAQQTAIKRTDLLKVVVTELDGREANFWAFEFAPGASTGAHSHPTSRFVYVSEGAVVLEVVGQPPKTFKAGDAFQELPGIAHSLSNASATAPAKGTGFQIVAKGQPLQQ